MGERGGATRIRAWKCPTCHAIYETRGEAVECCNDKLHEERRQKRAATKDRLWARAKRKVRCEKRISQYTSFGTRHRRVYHVLTVKCPSCKKKIEQEVVRSTGYGSRKLSLEEGTKRTKGLHAAHFKRHWCPGYRRN